ncbi:hypothetical protein E4U35_004427 [Claviceps purpurea]|nr:hypothetical protein E4U35_004427 [Claviceps purpurea]
MYRGGQKYGDACGRRDEAVLGQSEAELSGRYLRIPCILTSNVRLDALDGASRDRPLNNADPLSPLETTTLRDYVNRFVRGLYDKSVMQEAIGQCVLISDSLRSAFEIVQRAGSIQGVKTDIARQDARDAKITLMEAYIQRQSGCLASEELSRAYISCRPDLSMFGEAHRRLVPVDTLMAQLQPSMSHLGIRGSWTDSVTEHHCSHSLFVWDRKEPCRSAGVFGRSIWRRKVKMGDASFCVKEAVFR